MIDNYSKQENLIDIYDFDKRINVIGCGALGSWLVFFLLKMGFNNIHAYDFDTIEEHNIPNQFFRESDIGKKKVDALYSLYTDFFNEDTERLHVYDKRLKASNSSDIDGIVFCCTDTMGSRKTLYNTLFKSGKAELWIEDRLGLFGGFIYTLYDRNPVAISKYEETFYEDEDAEVSRCGVSQTALPSATNVASLMLMQMISHYRGNQVYNSIQYQIPDLTHFKRKWLNE